MASINLPIFLMTDFGLRDTYVGQMRAVIASAAPDSTIYDLTHQVPSFSIEEGAWLLSTMLSFLPDTSITLVIVDPGVGGSRRPIAIKSGDKVFIAPDNGLLSVLLADELRPPEPAIVSLPTTFPCVQIERSLKNQSSISSTFHGRDIFAPAAAFLASGGDFNSLGAPLKSLYAFPSFEGTTISETEIAGFVIHVDHFGNLVTTIRSTEIAGDVFVQIEDYIITKQVNAFYEGALLEPVWYVHSSGYIGITMNSGNVADFLSVNYGDEVRLVRKRK